MKYLNSYKIFENELHGITIPKGTVLFHGTSEDFDIKELNSGSYDGVIWTAPQSIIAQTYIPVSGMSSMTTTGAIHTPPRKNDTGNIQKQFGIEYTDIEYDNSGRVSSFKSPEIWKDIRDKSQKWKKYYFALGKKLRTMKEEYLDIDKSERSKMRKEISNLQQEYDKLDSEYGKYGDTTKQEHDMINQELIKLGYVPKYKDTYNNNYRWELKVKYIDGNEVVLPADYREQGRLLILTAKEDLKLYDVSGGEDEGDLNDLEYHKVGSFKKAQEAGYDGIKINDFAQIEDMGNFGHVAYGFFDNTIHKFDIVSIPAKHPENFIENYKKGDYTSKEYREFSS